MSANERQNFRSKGIFTVTQLSYTFRPRRRPKLQRHKREKYHHALKALSAKTLATTVFSFGSSEAGTVDLACTDSCRVVYENATGVYSWGGDGPADPRLRRTARDSRRPAPCRTPRATRHEKSASSRGSMPVSGAHAEPLRADARADTTEH